MGVENCREGVSYKWLLSRGESDDEAECEIERGLVLEEGETKRDIL